MSDMPERIWRWAVPNSGGFVEYAEDYPIKSEHSAEYHRADAPLTPADALARCPEVAALVNEVRRLMPVIVDALDVHCMGDKHGIATPNAIRKRIAPFTKS